MKQEYIFLENFVDQKICSELSELIPSILHVYGRKAMFGDAAPGAFFCSDKLFEICCQITKKIIKSQSFTDEWFITMQSDVHSNTRSAWHADIGLSSSPYFPSGYDLNADVDSTEVLRVGIFPNSNEITFFKQGILAPDSPERKSLKNNGILLFDPRAMHRGRESSFIQKIWFKFFPAGVYKNRIVNFMARFLLKEAARDRYAVFFTIAKDTEIGRFYAHKNMVRQQEQMDRPSNIRKINIKEHSNGVRYASYS